MAIAIAKTTLARPYAKAAFEYANEHNDIIAWQQMLAVASYMVTDTRVVDLLQNPRVSPKELFAFFTDICGKYLNEVRENFLHVLIRRRRLIVLPEILRVFVELRSQKEKVMDVAVSTFLPLGEDEQKRLAQVLRRQLGRDVAMHCNVDKKLLGGIVIRAGDKVIDRSMRTALNDLAVEMMGV